jgi:hypothetical protein
MRQIETHTVFYISTNVDELMIPQLLELIDQYAIDGFWVDTDHFAVRQR